MFIVNVQQRKLPSWFIIPGNHMFYVFKQLTIYPGPTRGWGSEG